MKKTLYIIRHGETDLNKQGIIQGRGMNTDLNEWGKKQADAFYYHYQHIPFDLIFTSTLKRTHQTVVQFLKKDIPWVQHEGLDELAWGIFEGKPSEITKPHFEELTTAWANGELSRKFELGESPLEVQARQLTFLEEVKRVDSAENVLVCMHGRALRLLLCTMSGLSLSKMDQFPHANVSLYKIYFDGNDFEIIDFNNRDHLKNL
jgi:probable phosphoglycerate mutase